MRSPTATTRRTAHSSAAAARMGVKRENVRSCIVGSEAASSRIVKNDRSFLAIVRGVQIATLPPAKDSEARDRLLWTASGIFYSEGINSVGVDRIVSDA